MLLFSPRDVLVDNVDHFSFLVNCSTIAVAIGVSLEGVELIHDAILWMKRRHLRKTESVLIKELAEIFPAGEAELQTESRPEEPSGNFSQTIEKGCRFMA